MGQPRPIRGRNELCNHALHSAAADDKTVEYKWDYRNRLEKVTFKRNDGTVTKTVEFRYDMFNQLTQKVVDPDGALGSASLQTDDYFWDGDELVGVYGYNTLVFASGPGPDMVLFESATTLHALLGDHLNTVRDVIATNGTVENHLVYNSYGELKSQTGGGAYSPFHRFTGKPFDVAVGLQYNVNRWYDPATGRWLSEDPIGFGGGHANLNVYVGNSPLSGIDPFGLAPVNPAARAAWLHRRLVEMATLQAYADMQRIVDAGSEQSVAGQFGLGVLQGGLNTINGVQDIVAATINEPADIWNSTAGALGAPLAPTLDSPDWSKGVLVHESDTAHEISKFLGGNGVVILAGAAGGRGGPRGQSCTCSNNPGGNLCFVAGTEVVLAHSLAEAVTTNADVLAMPEQSGPSNNLLMTTVLLVCAAQVAVRRGRRKSDEDRPILEDESDADKCVVAAAPSGAPCGAGEASFCSERGAAESDIRGAVIADMTRNYDLAASPAPPRTIARYATSSTDRRLLSKFAAWACLSACLVIAAILSFSRRDPEPNAPPSLARTRVLQHATAPIETVRVGQRVVTLAEGRHGQTSVETSVNPATWRHLRLQAVDVWPDGTRDVIEVETLQSPEWVQQHGAQEGAEVTLPLDLQEMGLAEDLQARVIANTPCPQIDDGPGRVVLTTVSHLNNDVWQLDIVDAAAKPQVIRPTGLHKFYSATRDAWISAMDLRPGEELRGVAGPVEVRSLSRLAGVHRVYNMTVEGEHVYRVSSAGVLVHNTGCSQGGNGIRNRGRNLGQEQGREFRPDQLELHQFDPNQPKHVRGWLENEQRRINQGRAPYARTPPGYQLGHGRTTPAREGFDYSNSRLQGQDLNSLEEQIRRRLGRR